MTVSDMINIDYIDPSIYDQKAGESWEIIFFLLNSDHKTNPNFT